MNIRTSTVGVTRKHLQALLGLNHKHTLSRVFALCKFIVGVVLCKGENQVVSEKMAKLENK